MQLISDFQTSVRKAMAEIDPEFEKYPGLIVCGTHDPANAEEQMKVLALARETGLPTLGICWGLQLMMVEFARNVLKIKDATSEEFGTGTPVIVKLPGFIVGGHPVRYQGMERIENHWHQYAFDVNKDDVFSPHWEMNYSRFILEYAKLNNHPYYVGTQFHPEYSSLPGRPHPLLVQFLNECKAYAT